MRCFVCRELIKSEPTESQDITIQNSSFVFTPEQPDPEHITLSLSTTPEAKLFFHRECFEEIAGDEFAETIEQNKHQCLLCLENDRAATINKWGKPVRGWTCDECGKLAPPCNPCKTQMVLRFSRNNRNIFWSCPKFPACKNSRSII